MRPTPPASLRPPTSRASADQTVNLTWTLNVTIFGKDARLMRHWIAQQSPWLLVVALVAAALALHIHTAFAA